MKLILSRKGFDSGYGGRPSPIFPDGGMVSIPIPTDCAIRSDPMIGDLKFNNVDLGELMVDLGASKKSKDSPKRARLTCESTIHRDPDIYPEFSDASNTWKAAFGQTDAMQSHLANQNVGVGDLFLFFGWFRRLQQTANGYRYIGPDMHTIFGWLQVGEVVKLSKRDAADWEVDEKARKRLTQRYPYLQEHPHVSPRNPPYKNNVMYVASDRLEVPGESCSYLPGAGAFRHFDDRLRLTGTNERSRTHWHLPTWFYPRNIEHALTFHRKPECWQLRDDFAFLKSADIGQEFVLDTEYYRDARRWAVNLIRLATAPFD